MTLTYDPDSAYRHTHQYMPGAKAATLTIQTAGGDVSGSTYAGYARRRSARTGDWQSFANAALAEVAYYEFDWWPADFDATPMAGLDDKLLFESVSYVIRGFELGRYGSAQRFLTVRNVDG